MLQSFRVASMRGPVCEAPPDFGDGAAAVFKNKLNFEQTFTNSKNPTSQVHISNMHFKSDQNLHKNRILWDELNQHYKILLKKRCGENYFIFSLNPAKHYELQN